MQIKNCMINKGKEELEWPNNFGSKEITKTVSLYRVKECEAPFKLTEGRPVY
jgi:hypothetical protein